MDEWVAFRRVEPDPVERVLHVLKVGFAALCLAHGMELEPESFEMPSDGKGEQRPKTEASQCAGPAEASVVFRAALAAASRGR